MAPSFAAGAISGEKERKTYEMLLASPLQRIAIVSGKMVASLTHLVMLIIGSLPTVILCLPWVVSRSTKCLLLSRSHGVGGAVWLPSAKRVAVFSVAPLLRRS